MPGNTTSMVHESAAGSERRLSVVVVAMKPQIAGRIRRNIMTLLDLGAQVTVVNTQPRDDFFQGLTNPRLTADFVDVRSLAVRYQARMTRKMNERQVRAHREKMKQEERSQRNKVDRSHRLDEAGKNGTSAQVVRMRIRAERSIERRNRVFQLWRVRSMGAARTKRDLTIRGQLKRLHLLNRFTEFWRLSPAHIVKYSPDLLVSSDLPGLVGASIAARRLGVPHIHDCHELYLESTALRPSEKALLWRVERRYMRRADSVVVVNQTIRDEYEKRYGVRGIVLRNCAPGVSPSVRANAVDLRALVGVPGASRIVLYQGGLAPGRGLDVCVRAVASFPDHVHMVFIGKGRMLDELRSLAEELNVADRIHWLPAVPPGDLPAYTAGADLGVIPYQPVSLNNKYALPNKVFEYTGAGIPFVATDIPELRRIVETARCGRVYDPFDPQQLAAAVSSVLVPDHYPMYRGNAEDFGRDNTWETERGILVSEVQRLTLMDIND